MMQAGTMSQKTLPFPSERVRQPRTLKVIQPTAHKASATHNVAQCEGAVTEITSAQGQIFSPMVLSILANLSQDDRWFAWLAEDSKLPKSELEAAGTAIEKLLTLRPSERHNALLLACRALSAGTCHLVLTWSGDMSKEDLAALEAAAKQGKSQCLLIRQRQAA